jgi:tetratricopeptide (TPR) repeat protein
MPSELLVLDNDEPALAETEPTVEEVRSLLSEMSRDPAFADRYMQIALLGRLLESRVSGTISRFTRQVVMDSYADAVRSGHDQHAIDFESGLKAGRGGGKDHQVPHGMDAAAFRAGVRNGKAERANGKWQYHPAKPLINDLRKTVGKYFAEERLRFLSPERQPTLIVTFRGYEPVMTRRPGYAALPPPIASQGGSADEPHGETQDRETASEIKENDFSPFLMAPLEKVPPRSASPTGEKGEVPPPLVEPVKLCPEAAQQSTKVATDDLDLHPSNSLLMVSIPGHSERKGRRMNLFEAVNQWRQDFPLFRPTLPSFRPFGRRNAMTRYLKDITDATRRLNPLRAARHDAVNGEPNLRTGALSTFDAGTRTAFQRELDVLQEETARQIQVVDVRLKRLPPLPTVDDATVLATADERDESVLRSWRVSLADSKRAELAASRGLTAFRRTNPPCQFRAVQSHSLLITIPGILAVACVEMVLSSQLLWQAGSHTPSEIITIVVLASVFNVLFGLCAGFVGLRNLGHADTRRKLAGGACLAVAFVLIVGLAGFLANYRNAIDSAMNDSQTAGDSASLRLQRMASAKANLRRTIAKDPAAFWGDLGGLLVFCLGITFGGLAALEGYYLLDDSYPGFGARARAYRRALKEHERLVKRFEGEFNSTIQTLTSPLDAALSRGERRLAAIKAGLDAAARTLERYEQAATAIEQALFLITMTYRDEYRRVRGNEGPENWQDEIPKLNREVPFDLAGFVAIEDRATADYRALEDQVHQLITNLGLRQAARVLRMKDYLAAIDQDATREEEIALADLRGVRVPPPPEGEPAWTVGRETV